MVSTLEKTLARELNELRESGQYKQATEIQAPQAARTQMNGKPVINLSSRTRIFINFLVNSLPSARFISCSRYSVNALCCKAHCIFCPSSFLVRGSIGNTKNVFIQACLLKYPSANRE